MRTMPKRPAPVCTSTWRRRLASSCSVRQAANVARAAGLVAAAALRPLQLGENGRRAKRCSSRRSARPPGSPTLCLACLLQRKQSISTGLASSVTVSAPRARCRGVLCQGGQVQRAAAADSAGAAGGAQAGQGRPQGGHRPLRARRPRRPPARPQGLLSQNKCCFFYKFCGLAAPKVPSGSPAASSRRVAQRRRVVGERGAGLGRIEARAAADHDGARVAGIDAHPRECHSCQCFSCFPTWRETRPPRVQCSHNPFSLQHTGVPPGVRAMAAATAARLADCAKVRVTAQRRSISAGTARECTAFTGAILIQGMKDRGGLA